MDYSYIDRNYAAIKERVENAKKDSDVLILAVIKGADVGEINYLTDNVGVKDVGENRVQQLLERYDKIKREDVNVHFIGKLQTNKVKYIIGKVSLIHSLDSESLAREIDRQAKKHGITADVLIEINIGREENKSGVMPEALDEFVGNISAYNNINVKGFMTMAPKCVEKDEYRKYFAETYRLVLDIWQKKLHNIDRPVLSMGMSGSFEAAIEEGSNLVRIGTALFKKEE